MLGQSKMWREYFDPRRLPYYAKVPALVPYGLGQLAHLSDKMLWGFVRDCQIAMCELMTQRFMKHNREAIEKAIEKGETPPPLYSEDEMMRAAANYTNTNLGTLPHHWMKPWARKIGFATLFARNWSYSNPGLVAAWVTRGRL